jgi:hypothetical protein
MRRIIVQSFPSSQDPLSKNTSQKKTGRGCKSAWVQTPVPSKKKKKIDPAFILGLCLPYLFPLITAVCLLKASQHTRVDTSEMSHL